MVVPFGGSNGEGRSSKLDENESTNVAVSSGTISPATAATRPSDVCSQVTSLLTSPVAELLPPPSAGRDINDFTAALSTAAAIAAVAAAAASSSSPICTEEKPPGPPVPVAPFPSHPALPPEALDGFLAPPSSVEQTIETSQAVEPKEGSANGREGHQCQHPEEQLKQPPRECVTRQAVDTVSAAPAVSTLPATSPIIPVPQSQPTAVLHHDFQNPFGLMNPGIMMPGIAPIQAPPIFHNQKVRSGKWTPEEERYANLLIEMFEKGWINEKNGCTLRSFLSRRLHCAPMRISKKFAGKGIGKMVFLAKRYPSALQDATVASVAAEFARLHEAEMVFYKVAFPNASMPYSNPLPHVPVAFSGLIPYMPNPSVGPMAHPGANTMALWAHQPQLFVPGTMIASPIPPNPTSQPQDVMKGIVHSPSTAFQNNSNSDTFHPPPLPSRADISDPGTKNMNIEPPQKSDPSPASTFSAQNIAPTPSQKYPAPKPNPTTSLAGPLEIFNETVTAMSPHLRELHQTYMQVIGQEEGRNNQQPHNAHFPAVPPDAGISDDQILDSFENAKISPPDPVSLVPSRENESPEPAAIPDLLSGFDQLTSAVSKTDNGTGIEEPVQHSPPFTSKSFDDFHRFLGKSLPPPAKPQHSDNSQSGGDRSMSLRGFSSGSTNSSPSTHIFGYGFLPAADPMIVSQAPNSGPHSVATDSHARPAQHSASVTSHHHASSSCLLSPNNNVGTQQYTVPPGQLPLQHFENRPRILPLAEATQADLPCQQQHGTRTISEPSNTSSDVGTESEESPVSSGNDEGTSSATYSDSDDSNGDRKRRRESPHNRKAARLRKSRGEIEIRTEA